MKNLITLSLLGSSMLIAPVAVADTFPVIAPIKKVTIYKNGGAQVTRSIQLEVPAGQHTIIMKNLHEALASSHIPPQATVVNGNTRITSVKFRTQPSNTAASQQQKEIQEKIEALTLEIAHQKNKITSNEMRLSFIKNIGQSQAGQSNISDLQSLQQALDFVGDNSNQILTEIQSYKAEIAKLSEQQNTLRRELERSGPPRKDYQQALVYIENAQPQTIEMALSYFVKDASWRMDTKAALDSDKKQMNIALSAAVSQTTGENWNDVALHLSNSRPSGYIGDTNVPSEFISFMPKDNYRRRELQAAAPQMDASFEEIMVAPKQVSISNSRFNRTYKVSGSSTIMSSGETEKLDITAKNFAVDVVTRAAPFFGGTAYVYADATLSDFPSIRNNVVTLSRDGHYAGSGRWPNLEMNSVLELPFGANPNITVSYQEQPPRDGDKGFISKKSVEEKRYIISVTNNGNTLAPVEILDRYPVSAHEDIKVTPLESTTRPANSNVRNKPGVIKWKKELKPGETWYIKHAYQITYPSDKQIHRTNR